MSKEQDLGRALGAPWYVRLGLKLGRGGVMSWMTKLFTGRPGALRTVLALFVLTTVTLPLIGRPEVAKVLQAAGYYTGLAAQAAGVPVAPKALGDAIAAWIAATIALVALLRPVVRWVLASRDSGLGSVSTKSLKG